MNEDLKYAQDYASFAYYGSVTQSNKYRNVIQKILIKHRAYSAQACTDAMFLSDNRNFRDIMIAVKRQCIHQLQEAIINKVDWRSEQDNITLTTKTMCSAYILSENDMKEIIWDAYVAACKDRDDIIVSLKNQVKELKENNTDGEFAII